MTAYLRPTSFEEALEARQAHPDWLPIAGGTDLMVETGSRPPPPGLIDLYGLEALVGIERRDGQIRIGASTTYAQILRSTMVRETLPMLCACAREVGAVQIQHRGTLGGNVVTSSPVGDTLPVLLALDATIELASTNTSRRVPYGEFCTGYRQTALLDHELLAALWIPVPKIGSTQYWRKVGTRGAQSISKVMVAATAYPRGEAVQTCRLAMGAVADRPIRLPQVETLILGEMPGPSLAKRVREAVHGAITPIDDVRSSAAYRRHVAGNLAARFVLGLA